MENKNYTSNDQRHLFFRWIQSLPIDYQGCNLNTCLELPQGYVQFGRDWAVSYPIQSLFLYGVYGSGKTTYAFAIIREYMEFWTGQNYYVWPRYITGRDLSKDLFAAFLERTEKLEVKRYAEENLLFIDDIDKVSPTDNFKGQMFDIINTRLIYKRPTIITSNCQLDELGKLFDGSVISRMQDRTRWQIMRFPDRDLRQVKVLT